MKLKVIFIPIIILTVLLGICMFILPPCYEGIVPRTFKEEDTMKESVFEKTYIDIDGAKIGIIITAKDSSNPVLLFCGGGPGIPQYLLEYMHPTELWKDFTVCYFDYRGTGLSYSKDIDTSDMTTERFTADVVAVTDYLRDRFNQEKIYIIGHSFGTYIALNTVYLHPERYKAYFAVSQICNQKQSELTAYEYMKSEYEKRGNKKAVKKFEKYPINTSQKAFKEYTTSSLRDKSMHDLGVGTCRNMRSVISGIFFPSLKCKAYTPSERINIWRGKIQANKYAVTEDTFNFNAFNDIPEIKIPIYFFGGQYDYTCCYLIQKEYYDIIKAPDKQFFTFEDSAHSSIYEQPDKAKRIIGELIGKQ